MIQLIENYKGEKQVSITKECIWQKKLNFNVRNINYCKQVALHLIIPINSRSIMVLTIATIFLGVFWYIFCHVTHLCYSY